MTAPANPQDSSAGSSIRTTGFYLHVRTKLWMLGICFGLMIAGSGYAVLQPLNPDPADNSFPALFWYPHETNRYARLQAVQCLKDTSDDYACRFNSVAVNGTGDLPEVWAVGNYGLVLHRAAGQRKWEQLTIHVGEDAGAQPAPTPGARSTQAAGRTQSDRRFSPPTAPPLPTPSPTATVGPPPSASSSRVPNPTPTPDSPKRIPYLIGFPFATAQNMAKTAGFTLVFQGNSTSGMSHESSEGQPQGVVIRQSPAAGTLAPAGSVISVTLGPTSSVPPGASLFDKLLLKVYAAEPEPQQPQTTAPTTVQENSPHSFGPGSTWSNPATLQTIHNSPLDDDLIHVEYIGGQFFVWGRGLKIYTIINAGAWQISAGAWQTSTDNYAESVTVIRSEDATQILTLSPESWTVESITSHTDTTTASSIYANTVYLWEKPVSRITTARIYHSAFTQDKMHGFIVGDHGLILSTSDGGKTWRHETQGPEGAMFNHRLPAGWYWALAGLLIILSSAVIAVPSMPPPAENSVADWNVTDAPLKPGDTDSLGFTRMALGLSRFIRNPKTQPPVTIAIEGEWGQGKSSVMSLLRGDLEKSRFRPVWFNAWHHQSEDQLLAALLEHIKSQGIPPWWHIDNWIFRARLLRSRFHSKWPLLLILTLIFSSSAAYEISRHGFAEFVDSPTNLIPFKNYIPFLKDEPKKSVEQNPGRGAAVDEKPGDVKPLASPSAASASPATAPCNADSDCKQADLRHLGLIASALGLLGALLKIAKAFGIDSSKLTDNLRDASSIQGIKSDPDIRRQFAREFCDFCKAWSWGGRRVVIFIDDLDRCRPESVVTVLESINFLTTAGDCMVVLGMAQGQVTHCIGLGFKDIAETMAAYEGSGSGEKEKAVARFKYGEFYIKKLVNIVAPLPQTSSEQRRRILELRAQQADAVQQKWESSSISAWRLRLWEGLSASGRLAWKIAPVMALLLAVVISTVVGYEQGAPPLPEEPILPTLQTVSAPPVTKPAAKPAPTKAKQTPEPLLYDRPATQPAKLVAAGTRPQGVWWSYGVYVLFLVIFFGIMGYQLSARTDEDAENSRKFEESLELWGEYIVSVCDTPREIKRAINDLRYQAMTRRTTGPSMTRGERLVLRFRRFITGERDEQPVPPAFNEAGLPPLKAGELAHLTEQEWKVFLDPAITNPGDFVFDWIPSAALMQLIQQKAQHIAKFKSWIPELTPDLPEPIDPTTMAKTAGQPA